MVDNYHSDTRYRDTGHEGSAHIGITPWLERTVEGRNPWKPGVKGCNCAYKGDGTLESIT